MSIFDKIAPVYQAPDPAGATPPEPVTALTPEPPAADSPAPEPAAPSHQLPSSVINEMTRLRVERRDLEARVAQESRRREEAEALVSRIQTRPADGVPSPPLQPAQVPEAEFHSAVQREAAAQRFYEDTTAVRAAGMTQFGTKFVDTLNVLQKAYRLIPVREGDVVFTLPTIQALMRQLARLAAKGNGPALRMFIKMIQTIEQEKASEAEIKEEELAERAPVSDQDRARALAAFMAKVGMKVSLPD